MLTSLVKMPVLCFLRTNMATFFFTFIVMPGCSVSPIHSTLATAIRSSLLKRSLAFLLRSISSPTLLRFDMVASVLSAFCVQYCYWNLYFIFFCFYFSSYCVLTVTVRQPLEMSSRRSTRRRRNNFESKSENHDELMK